MALQTLYSSLKDVHIECQSDNASSVAYINDMRGMKSEKINASATQIQLYGLGVWKDILPFLQFIYRECLMYRQIFTIVIFQSQLNG